MSVLSSPLLSAATATSSASSPGIDHLYMGYTDLSNNPWGISGTSGSGWYVTLYTASTTSATNSYYDWKNFANVSSTDVKAYLSMRRGITSAVNSASATGLPYQFGSNTKNVYVTWNFVETSTGGTGSISGSYNHTLDVFFTSSSTSTSQQYLKGELMIITKSSANSQTGGWGTKQATNYYDSNGNTWDVWFATMTSGGYSWPVIQYRKRTASTSFSQNLKNFFADAKVRNASAFGNSSYYVGMVEAGTEVKYGSGRVKNTAFTVTVN